MNKKSIVVFVSNQKEEGKEDATPKGMWKAGRRETRKGLQGGCNPKGNAEGRMREDKKGREGGTMHRPISGDTKGKGAMAVCLEAGQIAMGNVETMGGIISGSVPEHDNREQSRLIYYLVCCLIIALIYILCLIYILISNLYLVPVFIYK